MAKNYSRADERRSGETKSLMVLAPPLAGFSLTFSSNSAERPIPRSTLYPIDSQAPKPILDLTLKPS